MILIGARALGSAERATPVIISASGPAEETVRVVAVLLVARDPAMALWLGLGWASIEVGYTYLSTIALAQLAGRDDEDARRARELLPPAAFTSAAPIWGAVERIGASALHVGFTLIVWAVPVAFVVTAIVHSVFNLAIAAMSRTRPIVIVESFVCVTGGIALAIGLLMAGII